jgi:hypothetical protein
MGILSMSCPSAGNCSAGGVYDSQQSGTSETGQAFVVSEGGAVRADAGPASVAAGQCRPMATVGIYSDFKPTTNVQAALTKGWHLVADVAGQGSPTNRAIPKKIRRAYQKVACKSAWIATTTNDESVEKTVSTYQAHHSAIGWLSYWTPAVPMVGTNLEKAGGTPEHPATCGNAAAYVRQIQVWGGYYSTIQFAGSAICAP